MEEGLGSRSKEERIERRYLGQRKEEAVTMDGVAMEMV